MKMSTENSICLLFRGCDAIANVAAVFIFYLSLEENRIHMDGRYFGLCTWPIGINAIHDGRYFGQWPIWIDAIHFDIERK